jgi:hypothetical protein
MAIPPFVVIASRLSVRQSPDRTEWLSSGQTAT